VFSNVCVIWRYHRQKLLVLSIALVCSFVSVYSRRSNDKFLITILAIHELFSQVSGPQIPCYFLYENRYSTALSQSTPRHSPLNSNSKQRKQPNWLIHLTCWSVHSIDTIVITALRTHVPCSLCGSCILVDSIMCVINITIDVTKVLQCHALHYGWFVFPWTSLVPVMTNMNESNTETRRWHNETWSL
jgi:hypothetical protein